MSEILTGDCVEVMAGLEPESVDAIVTDPPYGLGFMGKAWDDSARMASVPPSATDPAEGTAEARGAYPRTGKGPSATKWDFEAYGDWCLEWALECERVAKPSAYLLAFGGTRTVHRMTVALEDAGWIIRDMLVWAYASGFPKSKASLKPAWEPIVMARKPGPLRMLAIDECRIGYDNDAADPATNPLYRAQNGYKNTNAPDRGGVTYSVKDGSGERNPQPAGRWPANVILTDPIFDGDTEGVVGGGYQESTSIPGAWQPRGAFPIDNPNPTIYGDSGTYSRFFLIPKADRTDREPVLGGLPLRPFAQSTGAQSAIARGEEYQGADASTGLNRVKQRANVHPTVKPTELMRHLVRLVTPPGGLVLDPFLGSGTTAIAAELEGFSWIGIEKEPEYVAIAEARLNGTQRGLGLAG